MALVLDVCDVIDQNPYALPLMHGDRKCEATTGLESLSTEKTKSANYRGYGAAKLPGGAMLQRTGTIA